MASVRQWLYRRAAKQRVLKLRTGEQLLRELAGVAEHGYGLTVWQWAKIRPAGLPDGHAAGSYHYRTFHDGVGQAFDAYGSEQAMGGFSTWISYYAARQVTEAIHNPGLSIHAGLTVDPSFWGAATWAGHRNHVHVACA